MTKHLVHADIYLRTITIPADVVLVGALVKIATTLIINGDVTITLGDEVTRLTGYHVIPAYENRKQAFLAHADTTITMIFSTYSTDIAEIESQFTDEADRLMSRHEDNEITITGIHTCQAP